MLKIRNVTKSFSAAKALNACSFDVPDGKITALIGPNGAGKTTLFNVVCDLVKEDRGKVILDGRDVSKLSNYKIAQAGISRTFQQVLLFKNLSIRDHFKTSFDGNDMRYWFSFFKEFKFKENREIGKQQDREIKEILDKFGLNKSLETKAEDLSYGQRKLLDLAVALVKPHKILLLDEPVAGVNQVIRDRIKNILLELKEKGETVLLIEHDIDFVNKISDKVVVLDEGKVLWEGHPRNLRENKQVLEAYLGE